MKKTDTILVEIQKFEKYFIEAGKIASKMRSKARVDFKLQTGSYEMDVVTEADIAVQEYILKYLSQSEMLRTCQLLAEEDTEYKDQFATDSKFVLTLDPIDGTYLYANGKKSWKVIVGIHDGKRPLYTFCYFPEYDWAIKMVENKCQYIGKRPKLTLLKPLPPKAIIYGIYGETIEPKDLFPEVYQSLTTQGYNFIERRGITDESSTSGQFLILSNMFSGYITDARMGSAVDILLGLHFGLSNGYRVQNKMDLSKRVNLSHGVGNYRGYYLILK